MHKNDQLLTITAGIVETARKNAGMTQKELADHLGVIQSTISRIELGNLSPTLFHWMKMCSILNIPHDAISIGYLDRCTFAKINSNSMEGGYALPRAYRDLKCVKVRWLLPFLNYAKRELGEKVYLSILSDLKMKPTFFINLDNQVNVNFFGDFISALGNHQKINTKTKPEILKYSPSEDSHGVLANFYRNSSNQMDLMTRFLNNISKYQRLFFVEFEKSNIDQIKFSINVEDPLKKVIKDLGKDTEDFLYSFFEVYLQKFSLFEYKHQSVKPKEIIINSSERDQNFRRMCTLSFA